MMNRYLFLPARLPQAGRHLMQALRDPLRKPLGQCLSEMATYGIKKGDPAQYLYGFLYRKGVEDPNLHLSHHEYRRLRTLVTRPETESRFTNKLNFQRALEAAQIPLPRYVGHVEDSLYHDVDGQSRPLSDHSDLQRILEKLLQSDRTSIFAKPMKQFGGKGAFKVTASSDLGEVSRALTVVPYLLQETMEQHPSLAAFHPASLNTMRIVTCIMRDEQVRVVSAQMKFGQGGAVVDNSSSGGFFAGIDIATGRINTAGVQSFKNGGQIFERHPDSGIPICDFQIPMFDKAIELTIRVADVMRYPLIGWDIAVQPDGPLVIEGNAKPDYFDDEILDVPHIRHPVMRPFIEELTEGRWL